MGINNAEAVTQANIHQMVSRVLAVGRLLAEAEGRQVPPVQMSEIHPTNDGGLRRESKVRREKQLHCAESQ